MMSHYLEKIINELIIINKKMTDKISLNDIPLFLKKSVYYRQFEMDEDEYFEIPKKYFKENDNIDSIDNFKNLVDTILYWQTDKTSESLFEYYKNNSEKVLDEYLSFFSTDKIGNLSLYNFLIELTKINITYGLQH